MTTNEETIIRMGKQLDEMARECQELKAKLAEGRAGYRGGKMTYKQVLIYSICVFCVVIVVISAAIFGMLACDDQWEKECNHIGQHRSAHTVYVCYPESK